MKDHRYINLRPVGQYFKVAVCDYYEELGVPISNTTSVPNDLGMAFSHIIALLNTQGGDYIKVTEWGGTRVRIELSDNIFEIYEALSKCHLWV